MELFERLSEVHGVARIAVIVIIAVLAHFFVQAVQRLSARVLAPSHTPDLSNRAVLARRYPKAASLTSLLVSALTFAIYFTAFGLILSEIGLDLKTYLATATVLGLAIGFGSQSLVQDVVVGLTLVFSDVMDVGDVVEIPPGQVGRVQEIGLRFTTLVNFRGQRVYVPNRNINLVSRFRGGVLRAYVDVQIPPEVEESHVRERVERLASGLRAQHPAIVVADPETFGVYQVAPGAWRYLRIKFRIWPGQDALIQEAFRQRVVAELKALYPDYATWMVDVTFRVL